MEIKSSIDHSDQKFLPLLYDSYPDEFRFKAKKELNETKENIHKGLAILRECIKREKLSLSSDENFLLSFLRQAKYDFKKAEAKLRRSDKILQKFGDDLESSDIKRIMAAIDHNFVGLLPFRDGKGNVIVFARASAWKKELFDIQDATLALLYLAMFVSTLPLTSVCGFNYLSDAKLEFYYDLLPMFDAYRKNFPNLISLPFRIQRIDVVNVNNFCQYLFAAIKPFIPAKLKERLNLHGSNFEKIQNIYPPSMLPFEFGGTMGPLSCDSYRDKFVDFLKRRQSEMKQRVK